MQCIQRKPTATAAKHQAPAPQRTCTITRKAPVMTQLLVAFCIALMAAVFGAEPANAFAVPGALTAQPAGTVAAGTYV